MFSRLAEEVVLYLESNAELGTMFNYKTNEKTYLNKDMVEIVLHRLCRGSLQSFFPLDLPVDLRDSLLSQSLLALRKLEVGGFLVKSTKQYGDQMIKKIKSTPPLRVVFVETTKRCNLKCRHCYNGVQNNSDEQLSKRELRSIVAQADDLGVMEIQLTGGELFVLPSIDKLITDLQNRHLPTSIFSNGLYIPQNVIDLLKNKPYGIIFYISLDGPEVIHDNVRGKNGAYGRTVANIKTLLQLGCDVRINTAVGSHNIAFMEEFMDFVAKEFGVLHRIVSLESIGNAEKNSELLIAGDKFTELIKNQDNEMQFLDSHDPAARDWQTPACGVGNAMLFIDAYGNVSLCPTLTQREDLKFLAGNIRQLSLKDIWENSPVFDKYRNIQCRHVNICAKREFCSGGCRSKAYLDTGDINSPDLEMCAIYDV
jgi:radical SAM protein with 4Fe4S-binding SPASM domain